MATLGGASWKTFLRCPEGLLSNAGFTRRAGDSEPQPDAVFTDGYNGLEGKGGWSEPEGRQEAGGRREEPWTGNGALLLSWCFSGKALHLSPHLSAWRTKSLEDGSSPASLPGGKDTKWGFGSRSPGAPRQP